MIRALSIAITTFICATACGQQLVPVVPYVQTQQYWMYPQDGCEGNCCPPDQGYYAPQRQRPRQRIAPDNIETPPVGAPGTPKFECLPSPPQPTTPDIDRPALDSKTADDIKALQDKLAALEKQLAQVKECDCDGCCDKLRAELNARIETLSQAQLLTINDVKVLKESQPNYDAIAAEVQKRLTHSATVTLLDGSHKTQTKPLNEPLEFIQHSRGVK